MNAKGMAMVVAAVLMGMTGASAQDGLGIGVIVGEPTGLSVKMWLSQETAIDGAVAWSFTENDSLQIHADYLIHNFGVLRTASDEGRLPVYFGLGGRVKLKADNGGRGRNENDALIGVRIPFGMSYLFAKAPLELFGEVVPILDVVPDTTLSLDVAIGARFYFR